MSTDHLISRIDGLFERYGNQFYDDARQESVTALEHALQCAQLAEWADADLPLVAAALLHDIGHFLALDLPDSVDDTHEQRAVPFLAHAFDRAVTEPIRQHVQAKRYLVRIDAEYAAQLSTASQHSLRLQGGPMSNAQMRQFEAEPFAIPALQLRRWDDLAKEPGRRTPPLSYYLMLLDEVLGHPYTDTRIRIGAPDIA